MSAQDLVRAMLDNAAREYVYPQTQAQLREHAQIVQEDAADWLHSPAAAVGSFRWACKYVGVDPDETLASIEAEKLAGGRRPRDKR